VKSIRQDKCCSIEGCTHKIYYAERQICQMHYFRFMRNGTYEKIKQGKNRTQNQVGYQMIPNSEHPLAMKNGYVYEHRMVFFDSGKFNGKCEVCGVDINWGNLHIDHKDDNIKNNDISNLRSTCRNCNTTKGRSASTLAKNFLTCRGITLSIAEWARRDDVDISATAIKRRYFEYGMSAEDAIFSERKTHQNTKTKKTNLCFMQK
jgi:hypothetical protein